MYIRVRYVYGSDYLNSETFTWLLPYHGELGEPLRQFVQTWAANYPQEISVLGFSPISDQNDQKPLFGLPGRKISHGKGARLGFSTPPGTLTPSPFPTPAVGGGQGGKGGRGVRGRPA